MLVKRINALFLPICLVASFSLAYADNREIGEEFFDQVYAIHSLRKAGELNEFSLILFKSNLIILRDRYIRKGGENYKMIQAANLYIETEGTAKEYLELWFLAADALLSSPADILTKEEANEIVSPILKAGIKTIKAESAARKASKEQERNKRIVIDIQTYLTELGYDIGKVDGNKGPVTLAAINQFKMDNGFSTYENYTDGQLLIDLRKVVKKKGLERRSAQLQTTNRYTQLIQEHIQRSWILPPSSGNGLSSTVQARLNTKGEVIDVLIVRSSGSSVFDLSIKEAVFKASPLPVPKDPQFSQQFRNLVFEFKP